MHAGSSTRMSRAIRCRFKSVWVALASKGGRRRPQGTQNSVWMHRSAYMRLRKGKEEERVPLCKRKGKRCNGNDGERRDTSVSAVCSDVE
jgi:hypothetical protein